MSEALVTKVEGKEEQFLVSEKVLLRATDLHKAFGGETILKGVSLELHRGEVVLLRGNNGSGKTTLLNILTGNIEPDSGELHLCMNSTSEHFLFPRQWWQNLNPFAHFTPERLSWEGVGRTWQDIRLFATQSLRNNISVAIPHQLGENPLLVFLRRSDVLQQEKEVLCRADNVLENLGLKGRENSSADKVSLGQSKRVAIARAVQAGAQILFLDEPLAGLDTEGIAEVMSLLRKLVDEHKVTLVIVEHLLSIPRIIDIVTKVWTLANGKLTVSSMEDIKMAITLSARESELEQIENISNKTMVEEHRLPGGAVLSLFSLTKATSNEVAVAVEDLVVHRGRRLVIGHQEEDGVIRGVSFVVRQGQIAILKAPNGWGKTTLLEAVSGLLPITRGTIRLYGNPVQHLQPWERKRRGLALLQARNNTFSGLTVKEMLRFCNVTNPPKEIAHLLMRKGSDLSGGEKQKVALACFQGNNPTILMMDEPFSALDTDGLQVAWKELCSNHHHATLIALPKSAEEN